MSFKYFLFLFLFVLPEIVCSQNGGQNSFSFLNIEHSPRIEALGGGPISIIDDDVSIIQSNPSLLNSKMHNEFYFSFVDYFADINLFSFSFAHEFKNIGVFGLSLKSVSYGDFESNDQVGSSYGFFNANDQVMSIGLSKKLLNYILLGINFNILNSNYESYNSSGLAANIGITYFNKSKKLYSSILIKNLGRQLTYYNLEQEKLPFEIQFAISRELKYLPFKYFLSYDNINNFDISSTYKLKEQTNLESDFPQIIDESIAKTLLRHVTIGGELNPFRKSLYVRGGFNFQRRFDLTTEAYPAMIGFSWGIGFRVSKYSFDYSRSVYHLSGSPNNFSIATNLSTFGL